MITAIGIDLVEIDRIRRALELHYARFLERCFHPEELTWLDGRVDPAPGLAARFAAKEAFQKCWPAPLGWKDAWVIKDGPRPSLKVAPRLALDLAAASLSVHLSLTHARSHAAAVVVLERAVRP